MKILLGYSHYKSGIDINLWVEDWLARLRESGIDITGFCLTIDPPGSPIYWPELDEKWKQGDKKLFEMYARLSKKILEYDVFINWNGINLHPDFVRMMPIFKAYSCFDDPESSEILSKPVCLAYDICLVGNIAEVETYKSWGVKNAFFWPLGFFQGEFDPSLNESNFFSRIRDVDITLLCERKSGYRAERLDKFVNAFPDGEYYGFGWPKGFLKEEQKVPLYHRTKIGINIHNSTGPINFRTYALPANGVMLICDNKSHLGKIYKLGEEAVGFDTIEEAVELCKYYLKHSDERLRIAFAGWKKATTMYNEVAVFRQALSYIREINGDSSNKCFKQFHLAKKIRSVRLRKRTIYYLFYFWIKVYKRITSIGL